MTNSDLKDVLGVALGASGRPSSDYDLNPEIVLPTERRLRDAAVLIPVVDRPSGPGVILTKRSSALKYHPGQIAFPGGKVEDHDTNCTATALREAQEEIALGFADVAVIGELPPHETVTGFQVTPVLAIVTSDFAPDPDTSEVAEVFEVPFAHVMNLEFYRVESRLWRGQRRYYFTVPWGPFYIWGATARILRALADRMANAKA
ncbi:MAG: CoA pyrophosphatase [Silicimonas sp.]|nr:CoA pyrophosphatase [Silicimonas sp.]